MICFKIAIYDLRLSTTTNTIITILLFFYMITNILRFAICLIVDFLIMLLHIVICAQYTTYIKYSLK